MMNKILQRLQEAAPTWAPLAAVPVACRRMACRLRAVLNSQAGQAMPMALMMLTLGSLLIVPCLDYASTSLRFERVISGKAKALYAAEAGVEDGLWRLKYNEPASLPYSYSLPAVNTMSVNVLIEKVATIAGEALGEIGVHEGWLELAKVVSYASGVYTYALTVENHGGGNMKVQEILIDLPPDLQYLPGSTSGNMTNDDPEVVGSPDTGIALVWHIPSPYFTIGPLSSETHTFQLSGPADLQGVDGHTCVKATREDVGTVWDADSRPFSITAEARDASNVLMARLRAGVWRGTSGLDISGWRIVP